VLSRYGIVPADLLQAGKAVSLRARALYALLALHAGYRTGVACLRDDQLVADLGCTFKSIWRIVLELVAHDWLRVAGEPRARTYTLLHWPLLGTNLSRRDNSVPESGQICPEARDKSVQPLIRSGSGSDKQIEPAPPNAHGAILDRYRQEYQAIYSADPVVTGADRSQVGHLLHERPADRCPACWPAHLVDAVTAFLEDPDPWLLNNRHPLRNLRTRVNKYLKPADWHAPDCARVHLEAVP
jgi:hypothetical protein